ISSLEMVAAPCRANARRASDFPAPMPPVMATATGRRLVLLFLRRFGIAAVGVAGPLLLGGDAVGLDALVELLGGNVLGSGGVGLRLGEDLLGETQLRSALAAGRVALVYPLERERE